MTSESKQKRIFKMILFLLENYFQAYATCARKWRNLNT